MTQVHFACVAPNGRIVQHGGCSHNILRKQPARGGEQVLEWPDFQAGMSDETHWWDGSAFVIRPTLSGFDKSVIAADGIDKAIMSRLPDVCAVKIDGELSFVTDGIIEVTSDVPAEYEIAIDHFPYRQFKTRIVST